MRLTTPRTLLLALIFAIGQWCAVVHGTQHELSGSAAEKLVACEICALGHSAAPPPPASLALALLPGRGEAPAARPVVTPARTPQLRPPPRGPPLFLV